MILKFFVIQTSVSVYSQNYNTSSCWWAWRDVNYWILYRYLIWSSCRSTAPKSYFLEIYVEMNALFSSWRKPLATVVIVEQSPLKKAHVQLEMVRKYFLSLTHSNSASLALYRVEIMKRAGAKRWRAYWNRTRHRKTVRVFPAETVRR